MQMCFSSCYFVDFKWCPKAKADDALCSCCTMLRRRMRQFHMFIVPDFSISLGGELIARHMHDLNKTNDQFWRLAQVARASSRRTSGNVARVARVYNHAYDFRVTAANDSTMEKRTSLRKLRTRPQGGASRSTRNKYFWVLARCGRGGGDSSRHPTVSTCTLRQSTALAREERAPATCPYS